MAKKKTKKKKAAPKKSFTLSPEMTIIIMLIVGIMLGVLIYTGTGQIGSFLSPVLGGLIGIIKYVIPVGIVISALSLMKEDSDYVTTKITQFTLFIVCICVAMHIQQFSKLHIANNITFEEIVKEAYNLGTMNKGGGAIGAIVSTPLTNLLGNLGATILVITIAIVTFMYIIGANPIELLIDFVDGREDRKEEKKARKEEQRQAFNEKREARRKSRTTTQSAPVKQKAKEPKTEAPQPELIQDEIVINHFNEKNDDKKSKFGLFGKKEKNDDMPRKEEKRNNPDELENIFKEEKEEKEEKTKAVLQLDHYTHTVDDENYEKPPIEMLTHGSSRTNKGSKKVLTDTATKLQKTLYSFGVSAKVENVSVGPVITRYELKPAEGSRKVRNRVGRGTSSGNGKTSGRGQKGQKARSGVGLRPGFEGGQTPLFRRLPKRGFTNINAKEYTLVNLDQLNVFEDGTEVTPAVLKEAGIVRAEKSGVKVLGNGELTKKLTVKAAKFSKSAEAAITAKGGSIEVI